MAAGATVATFASALFIWFQVREMKRQTNLQRAIAESAVAPYVWADVRVQAANGWNLEFAIGNSGSTVARNVVVVVEPPFPQADATEGRFVRSMHEQLERGMPSVAPGREYSWTLGNSADLVNRAGALAHTVTIDCDGPTGPVARSQFTIDFESFRESVARHDGSLRDIAKEIKAGADSIVREQKRQSSALEAISERRARGTFEDVARGAWRRGNNYVGRTALAWRRARSFTQSTSTTEAEVRQVFMHVVAPRKQLRRLQGRLTRRGFRVGPAPRASGGVHVRVRAGTADEQIVRRVVARSAPNGRFGPQGAPTVHLDGYRSRC